MRKMMAQILAQPQGAIRVAGLVAAAIGVVVVWSARG
jgi:uncharacterized protein YjeT (DUF2065 family)